MNGDVHSSVPADLPIRIEKVPVEKTLQLRHSVLWPDMPLSHVRLPEDDLGVHYGVFLQEGEEGKQNEQEPVAVISLFVEDLPSIDKAALQEESDDVTRDLLQCSSGRAVRFRKFACAPHFQGRGLGTKLLLHALLLCRSEQGAIVAWCDARKSTMEWYRKRGLVPFGNTFYKGRVEYIRMLLDLRSIGQEDL
ncbi:hypothetical protein D9613_012081 [Agrocybe pediades]|uniref:N-acetyltransferase domain-containing protein n=1 Tax=Agrocybe pediades TaxID=84607 RepID=A0A8H4R411_9AGAR|nr:hypothetical protein D9613_012081 [Agrocybe pediades]